MTSDTNLRHLTLIQLANELQQTLSNVWRLEVPRDADTHYETVGGLVRGETGTDTENAVQYQVAELIIAIQERLN